MAVAKLDLKIYQGDTYIHSFIWEDANRDPIDNTGMLCTATFRQSTQSSIDLEIDSNLLGGITLGGASGTIDIVIDSDQSVNLAKSGVWDLQMLVSGSPDVVDTLLYGSVSCRRQVTE